MDAAENERVTVAGWGSTSEGGGQPSKLHEVEVDVWSNQKCKNSYGNRIPGKIVDTMICAASSNKDSCSVSRPMTSYKQLIDDNSAALFRVILVDHCT